MNKKLLVAAFVLTAVFSSQLAAEDDLDRGRILADPASAVTASKAT